MKLINQYSTKKKYDHKKHDEIKQKFKDYFKKDEKMTIEEFNEWYDLELVLLTYGELSDEDILTAFKDILSWKKEGIFISDDIPDNKYTITEYWLYLSLLYKCIDYGTSPRGAWLTEFGEGVLDLLVHNYEELLLNRLRIRK